MEAPWYNSQTFKAMTLTVCTLACNAIARKFVGVELNATEIAGLIITVVAFIAGRQYKSVALAKLPAAPTTGEEAAKVATAPVP